MSDKINQELADDIRKHVSEYQGSAHAAMLLMVMEIASNDMEDAIDTLQA